MPYIGSAVKSINTRSAIDHQQFLGSTADTITNPGFYTFYVNYSPGNISVFVAGNNISHTDYTANNGTDVRISTGTLTINPTDNVEIIGYNVPTSQVLERTEVNITGGTISNTTISNSNFIGVNNAQLSVGLPIIDSSGNTVISESGGTVTIANSVQLSADSVVSSSSHTFRNKIINGNFDIWQRGTSQTTGGYKSADRFSSFRHILGSGSISISRQSFSTGQTDVPGNPRYYFRNVVVAGTGTQGAAFTEQRIENVRTLAGKKATLSFWAKADANKVIGTDFTQDYGTNGNGPPAGEPGSSTITGGIEGRTYNVTTSWQKFTTTVDIPSNSGATFGADLNTDYLSIRIYFSMGSDFSVGTNNDYTPIYSSIRNIVGYQSGTFDIAQIQLEEGSVATPFEQRPIGTELNLCQRYFEKSYALETAIGTSTQTDSFRTLAPRTLSSAVDYMYSVGYKVTKRSETDLNIYSTDGTIDRVRDISGASNSIVRGALGGASNLMINFDIIDTRFYAFHWTADAEL